MPLEANVRVLQGAYEGSGVDPVRTMVEMLLVNKAYEMNANMLQMQARSLQRAATEMIRMA
jgi:flagellar basal body rod protein FlgG